MIISQPNFVFDSTPTQFHDAATATGACFSLIGSALEAPTRSKK